jgi:hypothetical protein
MNRVPQILVHPKVDGVDLSGPEWTRWTVDVGRHHPIIQLYPTINHASPILRHYPTATRPGHGERAGRDESRHIQAVAKVRPARCRRRLRRQRDHDPEPYLQSGQRVHHERRRCTPSP